MFRAICLTLALWIAPLANAAEGQWLDIDAIETRIPGASAQADISAVFESLEGPSTPGRQAEARAFLTSFFESLRSQGAPIQGAIQVDSSLSGTYLVRFTIGIAGKTRPIEARVSALPSREGHKVTLVFEEGTFDTLRRQISRLELDLAVGTTDSSGVGLRASVRALQPTKPAAKGGLFSMVKNAVADAASDALLLPALKGTMPKLAGAFVAGSQVVSQNTATARAGGHCTQPLAAAVRTIGRN